MDLPWQSMYMHHACMWIGAPPFSQCPTSIHALTTSQHRDSSGRAQVAKCWSWACTQGGANSAGSAPSSRHRPLAHLKALFIDFLNPWSNNAERGILKVTLRPARKVASDSGSTPRNADPHRDLPLWSNLGALLWQAQLPVCPLQTR